MSLNYYLSKRKMYNNLICNFNSIISEYDNFLQLSLNNMQNTNDFLNFEISQMKKQKNKMLRYLKHIDRFQIICNNHINTICSHQFENDSIDITPELSQNICYCTICGYTLS